MKKRKYLNFLCKYSQILEHCVFPISFFFKEPVCVDTNQNQNHRPDVKYIAGPIRYLEPLPRSHSQNRIRAVALHNSKMQLIK